MFRVIAMVATAATCLLGPAAIAQDGLATEVGQRIEEAKARLDLSDAQVEQLAPVLEESAAAQRRIMSTYGIDLENGGAPAQKLGMRNARAMRQELDVVREDTQAAVREILTDEQFEEFNRMQEERRAEMRKRLRGRR